MKNLIILVALLTLGVLPVLAQKAAPPPPPRLAPDYMPKLWKEYSYADDNVKFRFPAAPSITATEIGTAKHPARAYSRNTFISFNLVITDTEVDAEEMATKAPDMLDRMMEGGLDRIKQRNPKIIKQSRVSVDGHPGMFAQVETDDGVVARFKFFLVGKRQYYAWTEVKKGSRHGMNWENDFEIPAMAFLDSIGLANK